MMRQCNRARVGRVLVLVFWGLLVPLATAQGEPRPAQPRQEIWYHTGYPGGVVGPRRGMSARMGPTKMPVIFKAVHEQQLVPLPQIHTNSTAVKGRAAAAPPMDLASLRAVHTDRYLKAILTGKPRDLALSQGLSAWSPDMARGWLLNVGGLYAAATAALDQGTITANLGHGYHHAGVDRGEGYCTINGLAVVAKKLLREGRARRVMVIDLDQHEGNGTAACTLGDPRIWNVSLYGTPMDGPPPASNNHVIQVRHDALSAGTARDVNYLAAISQTLPELIRRHNPDLILYQAGMDPHDCSGITPQALAQRDAYVFALARSMNKPVTWVLAGGYADVKTLERLHTNTVRMANRVLQKIKPGAPINLSNPKPNQWSLAGGKATFPNWSALAQGHPTIHRAPAMSQTAERQFVQKRQQLLAQQKLDDRAMAEAYRVLFAR